jgi:hypothetical protein
MHNPLKRKPKPYVAERDRLLELLKTIPPDGNRYELVLTRINELDKILNRTTELKKTVIPAFGAALAVGAVYAVQQFGGVMVPKALERIELRHEQKKSKDQD